MWAATSRKREKQKTPKTQPNDKKAPPKKWCRQNNISIGHLIRVLIVRLKERTRTAPFHFHQGTLSVRSGKEIEKQIELHLLCYNSNINNRITPFVSELSRFVSSTTISIAFVPCKLVHSQESTNYISGQWLCSFVNPIALHRAIWSIPGA